MFLFVEISESMWCPLIISVSDIPGRRVPRPPRRTVRRSTSLAWKMNFLSRNLGFGGKIYICRIKCKKVPRAFPERFRPGSEYRFGSYEKRGLAMKIVIAGAGEMGSHLARMLRGNGHEIAIVDSDPKALAEVASLADVISVEGDSTTFAVLPRRGPQVRPVHRRKPRGECQHRFGHAGQAPRGRRSRSRGSTTTNTSNPTTRGDVHRHGHRLPVLSREGRGPRGDQPPGPYLDDRVCRFLERQALAGGLPPRTGLAAGGRAADGLRRGAGVAEPTAR